jgi:excisionase family DNA binding protein
VPPGAAQLYSVDQVADRLGLHVRTVRNYVRDGRLRAVRIGKQYRIAQADLDALIGEAASSPEPDPVRRQPHLDCSTVVQVDGVSRDQADRLANTLMAATAGHHDEEPLRVETTYNQQQERMKIIVLGGLAVSTEVLRLIDTLTRHEEPE